MTPTTSPTKHTAQSYVRPFRINCIIAKHYATRYRKASSAMSAKAGLLRSCDACTVLDVEEITEAEYLRQKKS